MLFIYVLNFWEVRLKPGTGTRYLFEGFYTNIRSVNSYGYY